MCLFQDSKIVHPVAMRVSPDGQPLEAMERARVYPGQRDNPGWTRGSGVAFFFHTDIQNSFISLKC